MIIKKVKEKGLVLVFLFAFVISVTIPVLAVAAEESSQVTYNFKELSELTVVEKEKIVKGAPREVLTHDFEDYVLVYEKESKETVTPINPIQKPKLPLSKGKGEKLPQTGEELVSKVFLFVGIALLGVIISIFLWKKKRIKEGLMLLLLLASLGSIKTSIAKADQSVLKAPVTISVPKLTKNIKVPDKIQGYKYVGYIHKWQDVEPPVIKEGIVEVMYQDEAGNEIAPSEKLTGVVGENYQTVKKDIANYVFKEVTGNATGTYSETKTEVVYVYTKVPDPIKEGIVEVMYQDEAGNEIAPSEKLMGVVGENYQTVKKDIANYVFKEVTGNATGTYSETKTEVVYVYTKVPDPIKEGIVEVMYQDEAGTEIAPSEKLMGVVGENYQTVKKDIANYVFKEVTGNATGTYSETKTEVVYVYTKVPDPIKEGIVEVMYQDEAGNEIAPSEKLTGVVGENYQTVKKDIANYVFKEVTGNATGTYSETKTEVVYVYTKVPDPIKEGIVEVMYQDEAGNEIAPSEKLTGVVGENYQTVKKDIANYVFKEVTGNATGTYSETKTEVVYVYSQEALIILRFINENGAPATGLDLLNYGTLNTVYPNLADYYYIREYDSQRFVANEPITEIRIKAKIGEQITVPKSMSFPIFDDQNQLVEKLMSPIPNDEYGRSSGLMNYRAETSDNLGNVDTEEKIINYQMKFTPVVTPF